MTLESNRMDARMDRIESKLDKTCEQMNTNHLETMNKIASLEDKYVTRREFGNARAIVLLVVAIVGCILTVARYYHM